MSVLAQTGASVSIASPCNTGRPIRHPHSACRAMWQRREDYGSPVSFGVPVPGTRR